MDDWFQMAKDLAKAERELKIEQWVEVTIILYTFITFAHYEVSDFVCFFL